MVHSVIYHSTVSCHTLTPSMYPSSATTFHSASKCIQSILLQISSWLRYYVSAIWAWDRVLEWSMLMFLFPYMVLHPSNSMQILVLFVFVRHGVETSKVVNRGICSLNLFGYHRKLFVILLYSFDKYCYYCYLLHWILYEIRWVVMHPCGFHSLSREVLTFVGLAKNGVARQ